MNLFTKISLAIAFTGCLSCSSSIYKAIDNSYTPTEADVRSKKLILISDNHIHNSQHYIDLINSRKFIELEKELEKVSDIEVKRFLSAVRFMSEGEYNKAYYDLKKINKSSFDCEVQILLADCLHEQHIDTVNYAKRYQAVIDCTTDPIIKSIATKRYRFFKYGI